MPDGLHHLDESSSDPDGHRAFASPEPVVRLVNAFTDPFLNAVAAAKTCYSSKGVVLSRDVDEGHPPEDAQALPYARLAQSVYEAGHHTVFQHAYFQFTLENVSRQFIWAFLHAHPFYNSEQVSQRYVRVKSGAFTVPPMPPSARERYEATVATQVAAYERLRECLMPIVEEEYFRLFPGRRKKADTYRRTIRRKAQEAARYVLPVATCARLHHTVSALTLLRYHRACRSGDAPFEQQFVVRRMIDALLAHDPRYRVILEEPLDPEAFPEADATPTISPHAPATSRKAFDDALGPRVSRLVGYTSNAEAITADAVRETLGADRSTLSDDEALALALDPSRNRLLGESLNLKPHTKLGRCLTHASYTFRKRLSHSADSQNQRHRLTPGSRPILRRQIDAAPDYITPRLIQEDDRIRREYHDVMEVAWDGIREVTRRGAEPAHAQYLLPNAVTIRFTETGNLEALHHKYAMRLCYNAQEEIWQASVDEVEQICDVHPRIGRYLLPPCSLRHLAHLSPVCPEGTRYCGVKVWRLDPSEYERLL